MARPKTGERPKNPDVSIRMRRDLRARLNAAKAKHPFRLTTTQIIERGLELALDEMEKDHD